MLDGATRRQVSVPALGFGAASLGNLYRETTDEAAAATVNAAWEADIRYYDTAPHYGLGLSERRLGAALTKRPRLGLDRVDIVYLHDPDDHFDEAVGAGLPALLALREQGVIGAIGVGMNQSAMPAEFVRRFDIDLVMLAGRYTLLDQSALDDLLPLATRRRVRIIAAGVYDSGLLSLAHPAADATYDYRPAPPHLIERARLLAAVCADHGVDLPTAAIHFPLRHPAITSVVVGARSVDEVRVNTQRWSTPPPDELWAELESTGLIQTLDGARI